MLRSLVGSEMCIRDRHDARPGDCRGQTQCAARPRRCGFPHRAEVELHATCLLYTSDAADDLLCVDLGGRRIIKKKNNKTPHTTQTMKHVKHNNDIDLLCN